MNGNVFQIVNQIEIVIVEGREEHYNDINCEEYILKNDSHGPDI